LEESEKRSKEILILGFGSDVLSDEGIALHVLKDLEKKWNKIADFNTYLVFNLDVINDIAAYKTLILIDACEEELEGIVKNFPLEDYIPTLHLSNYHDTSLPEGIAFGRQMDFEMPEKIEIITISIKEIGLIGNDLTKKLKGNYDAILEKIEGIITELVLDSVNS